MNENDKTLTAEEMQYATGRLTGLEYKSVIIDELANDDAANVGHEIPPRIYALIDRAFLRAHAGEFKS